MGDAVVDDWGLTVVLFAIPIHRWLNYRSYHEGHRPQHSPILPRLTPRVFTTSPPLILRRYRLRKAHGQPESRLETEAKDAMQCIASTEEVPPRYRIPTSGKEPIRLIPLGAAARNVVILPGQKV